MSIISEIRGTEIGMQRSSAKDLSGWVELYKTEKSAVSEQNAALKASENRRAANKRALGEAQARVESLRKQILETKSLSVANTLKDHTERCDAAIREIQDRLAAFNTVQNILQNAESPQAAADSLKKASIDTAIRYDQHWATYDQELTQTINRLSANESRFASADCAPIQSVKEQAAELRALHEAVAGPLSREGVTRKNRESNMEELRRSQAKIVSWCRQQRSTLESLTDHAHLLEFANSFQSNITVMDTNFLVLQELAEPLLPNPEVQGLIQEAISVWLGLEVYAFERINASVMKKHDSTGVESECAKWTAASPSIKEFLVGSRQLLDMPADEESESLTEPIKTQLRELLVDWDAHDIIAAHLSDFGARMASLQDYYNAIRRTVFSKLTLLTQIYNTQYMFERKPEYMDRLAELTDWVQVKSQSETWMQLHQRVNNMKVLIEENEALHGSSTQQEERH